MREVDVECASHYRRDAHVHAQFFTPRITLSTRVKRHISGSLQKTLTGGPWLNRIRSVDGAGRHFKRSIPGACRAARAEANSVGFMARLLMYSTIALAASGCAQNLPTASAFGTPQRQQGHRPNIFIANGCIRLSPPRTRSWSTSARRSGFGLTPYETLTSGFSAPMGMVTTTRRSLVHRDFRRIRISWFIARRVRGPRVLRRHCCDPGEVPVNVAANSESAARCRFERLNSGKRRR